MAIIERKNYRIYASLRDDINSGWIWINNPKILQRSILLVINPVNKNYFFAEALKIERNYLKAYNQKGSGRYSIKTEINEEPTIVMNEWYRHKLGDIKTKEYIELDINEENNLLGRIMACLHHPQITVRITTLLGLFSFIFAVISIIISLL